jgi:superfamily II DNA or RNA helicase
MAEVWIRRQRWQIVEERVGAGVTCLRVLGQETGEVRSFLMPCDVVAADRRRRARRIRIGQALARMAGHVSRASVAFTPGSLVDANLDILPFQIEPALALLAGRRRILLADGVGMGKTVQAGLLVRTVVSAHPEARVLVVAPTTLQRQWAGELESRFALKAHRADQPSIARLRASSPYLANPWMLPGVWLTSPDYLKQPHVLGGLPTAPWDLLVIDEAHQLAGDSQRHEAINQLAVNATTLALLTATPHDGDDERFRRLIAVGSRGDVLTTFRRVRAADTDRRRLRWLPVRLSQSDRRTMDAIDSFEHAARPARSGWVPDGLPLICAVFRRRALSSPLALHTSLTRRLVILDGREESVGAGPRDSWRQPGLFDADVISGDEAEALAGDSGMSTRRERAWLLRLQHLCTVSSSPGGRARGLSTLLRRVTDRAVVFTQYRDSLQAIVRALPAGRRASLMHGGLSATEQQRALDEFLAGRVDTLVATDVASQGLNLQTASRWAISFDVPWSPLRLEQRIGRVDRIGQRQRVHATVLTSRHPFDLELRSRLDARALQSAQAPLVSCRRWAVAAEGVAAWYRVQRSLARRWRHAAGPRAHETLVPPAFTHRWLGRVTSGVDAWQIPFVTTTGTVIERRIVVAAMGVPPAEVAARLEHRARVLTGRARLRATRRAGTRPRVCAPAQPGLFEGRPCPPHPTPDDGVALAPDVIVGVPQLLVRFITRPEVPI